MPDGSDDLPVSNENEQMVLRWLRAAIEEGVGIIEQDPAYKQADKAMAYVLGEQYTGKDKPQYLNPVVVNRTKKAIRTHVSTLTDIKPLFAYKTFNQRFKAQADLLNQIVVLWWVNNFVDIDLADGLRYALAAGTSYLVCEYDPHLNFYGDNRIIPKDPRDIIPIRPSRDRSIQNWEGLIIREAHSINVLRGMYPQKAHLILRGKTQSYGPVKTAFRKMAGLMTPTKTLDGLSKGGPSGKSREDEIVTYRAMFKDRRINTSSEKILMGDPNTNWSYVVEPGEPLYPRGRLVVATEHVVLFDGPNPYWHGRFNVVRLTPDPWPWIFGGLSLVHDLMPLNEAMNKVANDFLINFAQHANPGALFDKNAVPDNVFKRFDARREGWKMKINPTYGEGAKIVAPPQFPPWAMDFANALGQEFDNLSGTANLQALLNLRQSPSAETIQKYWEALTPEIRLEGRMLEAAIRELANMVKCNIFQFYSAKRRIMLLGDPGEVMEDLDYDPGNLVPAMAEGDDGYAPELDKSNSRDARARWFQRLFTFYVNPHSLLAMHAQDRKMLFLQLGRMGYIDYWTLLETLEVPGVGDPPPVGLPTLEEPFTEMVPDPDTGMPVEKRKMEVRAPTTITERLIAQNQLGIGMTQSPAGRKSSGQQTPQMKQKTDAGGAPRTVISESG
jgi:hypothetical protein